MQFFNIAVVILLINFKFLDKPLFGLIPILNGDYKDFTCDWYVIIGKTLCLTLMMNIFTPHISKLAIPVLRLLSRWKDRGFSS